LTSKSVRAITDELKVSNQKLNRKLSGVRRNRWAAVFYVESIFESCPLLAGPGTPTTRRATFLSDCHGVQQKMIKNRMALAAKKLSLYFRA
jgi:hypothetical protein